eukprot:gene3175-3645_t
MNNSTTDELAIYVIASRDWSDFSRYLSIILLTAIVISAAFIDLLIVIVIIADSGLREKPDTILIANLALCDFLVSAVIMPFSIDALIYKEFRFSQSVAVFIGFANFTFCISSIMTLMVLVIDQTLTIKWPFRYAEKRKPMTMLCTVGYTWLHSICCALPPMFGLSSYSCFIINTGPCTQYQWAGTNRSILFVIIVTSLTWGLALAVSLFCYCQIGSIAVKQRKKTTISTLRLAEATRRIQRSHSKTSDAEFITSEAAMAMQKRYGQKGTTDKSDKHLQVDSTRYSNFFKRTTIHVVSKASSVSPPLSSDVGVIVNKSPSNSKKLSNNQVKQKQAQRYYSVILKPAVTLLVIIVTYFCTWSPFCILLLLETAERRKAYPNLSLVFLWIGHCSSLLNPIIYFFRYERFRTIVCKYRRRYCSRVGRVVVGRNVKTNR